MLYKIVGVGSWDRMDVEPVQVIKVARGGLGPNDRHNLLVKRAASHVFADMIDRGMLRDGDIPIHIIALGATEGYGLNRNADGFKEAWCRAHHNSFVKSAKLYRNHRNKDATKRYGNVKLSTYCSPMRRVELLAIGNGSKQAAERNGGLVLPDASINALLSGKPLEYSMACILDPTTPVLTSKGYVGIADVKIGDKVLTHKGRWRTVTQLRRRKYTGEVVTWRMQGLPLDFDLTADHPMLAAKLDVKVAAQAHHSSYNEWVKKPAAEQFDWIGAGKLVPSDRVRACIADVPVPGVPVIDNEELAEILGTYMAEGSVGYNGDRPSMVTLTVHGDDWATHNLTEMVQHHWPDVNATLVPKTNSKAAFSLNFFSASLATFCAKLVGVSAETKKVPLGIYGAPRRVRQAFLGRWVDGDGWVDKGGAHISSCNLTALLSARDLILSLGGECVIGAIDHAKCKTSGYAGSGVEYVLSIVPAIAMSLRDASYKCGRSAKLWRRALEGQHEGMRTRYASRTIVWTNNAASYRLRKVARRQVVDAQTYNFEVADDHSYSLAGLASHNCKIAFDKCINCGNEAPSRAQYCTEDSCINPQTGYRGFGCREGLTKVADDGFMQGVDNPNPEWFDISEVGTHADRIAYGGLASYLKQAGVANFGGAELAEQLLPLELLDPFSEQPSALRQQRVLSKLAAIEGSLRENGPTARDKAMLGGIKQAEVDDFAVLGLFGGTHFDKALRALSDAAVVLSLDNFAKWACHGDPTTTKQAVAAIRPAVPFCFMSLLFDDQMERHLASNPFVPAETTLHKFATAAVDIANPLEELQIKRASMLSVLEQPPQWNSGNRQAADTQPLAKQYALYKLAFLAERLEADNFDALCRLAVLQNFVM